MSAALDEQFSRIFGYSLVDPTAHVPNDALLCAQSGRSERQVCDVTLATAFDIELGPKPTVLRQVFAKIVSGHVCKV